MSRVFFTMTGTMLLAFLFASCVLDAVESVPFMRSHMRTLRLCSRSLSDAIYLVCKDRGYNEPFSYSGEDEPRAAPGPGLVEECCYHSCSYDQLEQYCKPSSEEKRAGAGDPTDVIEDSYGIVNLPYSSARRGQSSEERTRSDLDRNGSTIKRKVDGVKKGSRKRVHDSRRGVCGGKFDDDDARRRSQKGRPCRVRSRGRRGRRRPGKASGEAGASKLPTDSKSAEST